MRNRIFIIGLMLFVVFSIFTLNAAESRQAEGNLLEESKIAAEIAQQVLNSKITEVQEKFKQLVIDAGDDPENKNATEPMGLIKALDILKNDNLDDSIPVSEKDIQGLYAYAEGKYAEAEELLKESLVETEQPFPLYFLACIDFENDAFYEASVKFKEVVALEPKCNSAILLTETCRQLFGRVNPDITELIRAYDYAYKNVRPQFYKPETEKQETESFSIDLSDLFVTPMSHDPIIRKTKELSVLFTLNKYVGLMEDYTASEDVEEKITLALLLSRYKPRLMQSLAESFPNHQELQVIAFLFKSTDIDDLSERELQVFNKKLAEIQAHDPENTFLDLLKIKEEVERPALSENELKILHDAVQKSEFKSYNNYKREAQLAESWKRFGALTKDGYNPFNSMPIIANAFRRACMNLNQLMKTGNADDFINLCADLNIFIKKVKQDNNSLLTILVSDSFESEIAERRQSHAEKTGNQALRKECLRTREKLVRSAYQNQSFNANTIALFEIPIQSFKKALSAIDYPGQMLAQRAAWNSVLNAEDEQEDVLKNLNFIKNSQEANQDMAEGQDEEWPGQGDFLYLHEYKAIVKCEEIGRPDAIPVLQALLVNEDPLVVRLAEKAIKAIEKRHGIAENTKQQAE